MHNALSADNVLSFNANDTSLLPPQNIDVEEVLLGGIMLDPGAIAIIVEILPPDAFYINAHKILYRAAISLHNQSKPTDLMCIMSWLTDHEQLAAIGGKNKLVQIMDRTVSSVNIDILANLLLEKYERRCLIHAANEARGLAHDGSVPIEEVKDRTEQLIYEITRVDAGANQVESFEEISPRIWERLEQGRSLGIKTGFLDLDALTGGFYPGTLTIAAARTGLGKTQMAIALTYEIAKQGLPVIFFSCEMSKEDIGDRLLARAALVNSNKLREGKINAKEWEHLSIAINNLNALPIHIHSVVNPSITQMRSVVRSVAAQYGGKLGLIVLDYIQLLAKDGANFNNRASELDTIVKELRALAKEFNVACFGLAQINRGVEGRSDKRPFLSDIRESGAIESHSDVVLLLYREDYYNPDTPDHGIIEIAVAKNRYSKSGIARMLFSPEYSLFRNMVRDKKQ